MPQNQELCFTDGAMPVLPTVRVLVGHAGRSPALCRVKPRSHRGCHQPLQCSDVSFPMCWQGEESWRRSQCLQVGNAYVIVYSITDRSSFESASELRIHLRRARQAEDIPIILVGNKSDLVRCREVSIEGERVRVCPHVPCYGSCYIPQYRGCQQGHTPSLTTPPPLQRAVPVLWFLTASSSRRRQPCSITWMSSLRGWCGSCACAVRAKSLRPATGARRASPRGPGASSTGWWPGTAARWPSKPAPSRATTFPCSESRHEPIPLDLEAGDCPLPSAWSAAAWCQQSTNGAGAMLRTWSC